MENVRGIYFDRVSQIRMERWTKGRTALIGDAAACVSLLAGEGTGLAMAEAYVLAEANARRRGLSHSLRPLSRVADAVSEAQAGVGSEIRLVLRSEERHFGIAFRNLVSRLLRIPFIANFFIGRDVRDDFDVADCGF